MKENNVELFEKMPVPKAVRIMAVPTILGQLIILIYNMADTFFLGQTGNSRMVAAASLILPVFNITLSLAGLAGIGGGALVSRLLGSRQFDEAKKVSSFSIYFGVRISGLFSILVLVLMEPLMNLIGADDDTFEYARKYALCVIVAGGIPTVLSNVLSSLLRSIGESKKAGFGVMMGGVINIFLDPLFMFVIMSEGNEITGAGIATCISNVISCVYFVIVIARLGKDTVLKLYRPTVLPSGESVKSIFSVGVPASLTTFLFDVDYMVLDKLMAGYGTFALAAIGIVLKVERLPLNVGIGLCQGMVPVVAYNYASKDYGRMRDVKNFSRNAGLVCAAVSILLYEVFAPEIISAFIDTPETVSYGITFLRVRSIATPFMFLSFFHVHLFNGFGEGKKALFLGVMRWAVFNIPMLFILNAAFGIYGLVWSQMTADILTVTLSLAVYRRFEKKVMKI